MKSPFASVSTHARPEVEYIDNGPKPLQSLLDKTLRRGKPVNTITDAARCRYVVTKPEQADDVVEELAKEYEVLDYDWATTAQGYAQRLLIVRFPNWSLGEVQIWERNHEVARRGIGEGGGGGHALYQESEHLPPRHPRKIELDQEQMALYSSARKAAGPDWKPVWDRGVRFENLPYITSGDDHPGRPVSSLAPDWAAALLESRADGAPTIFGTLDVDAFVFKPGEAWLFEDSSWSEINSSELTYDSARLSPDVMFARFPDLPRLPKTAFQSGPVASNVTIDKPTFGTFDGKPCAWTSGEAWVFSDGVWGEVNSSEVAVRGEVQSDASVLAAFRDVLPLPAKAFSQVHDYRKRE